MRLQTLIREMGPVKQAVTALVAVAVASFGVGASLTHILAQQTGLPSRVEANAQEIAALAVRIDRVETAIEGLENTAASLAALSVRVDSLFVLEEETYCLIRAHCYGLDPDIACQQTRRRNDE